MSDEKKGERGNQQSAVPLKTELDLRCYTSLLQELYGDLSAVRCERRG